MEPRIYSVSLFRDGVFCIIENFDGILYDIKSPVNYILYIGGLEIMMGFREFAKSQYDTIKLRDPALREEKEVFLFAGFFPFEHQAFFQHMFVQCLAVLN